MRCTRSTASRVYKWRSQWPYSVISDVPRQNASYNRLAKLSTADPNPYEPTTIEPDEPRRGSNWIRRIVILNAVLAAIPVSVAAYAYFSMQLELRRQTDSYTDGPIVYEIEFVGFSGSAWPILAYFLLPNLLMLVFLVFRTRSQRKT